MIKIPRETLERWQRWCSNNWFSSYDGEDYSNVEIIKMDEEMQKFLKEINVHD